MIKRLTLFLSLVILLVLAGTSYCFYVLHRPVHVAEATTIKVIYGDSIYKVAEKLQQEHIITFAQPWIWYARFNGKAEKIRAGEYAIADGTTPIAILDAIVKGDSIKYFFTMIEGWTVEKTIKALQKADGIVTTIDAKDQQLILEAINADKKYQHSEGLLFPDTYQYTRGTKDIEILKKAYDRLVVELEQSWAVRAENLPYQDAYELLIMASIIEKESGVDAERKQISGVFVERMLKGMRLQTDPTVIYGMGDEYKGKIKKKDLLTATPYNTYAIDGLPPSPISLVSKKALIAAANPLLNGMLFFVAKGNGYHYFSKTLSEHEQAVREYQIKRAANYRSVPLSTPSSSAASSTLPELSPQPALTPDVK